ncbi:hypothetical protein ACIPYQ_29245 [Streptomyces sp. NPDC090045]|uniref:hypothetical protein n=1 Tax=Streptomyces sp. NPDC090045 TaxID=3365927 RepID=UPI00381BC075
MKIRTRLATIGSAAMAAMLLGAGGSHAADDGSLLSLLNLPSVTLVCYPTGQAGANNTFTGTQTVNCSQSATATNTGNGITGYQVVSGGSESGTDFNRFIDIECPAGKHVLGRGATVTSEDPRDLDLRSSGPSADGTSWQVAVENSSGNQLGVEDFAICTNASS